MGRRLRPFQHDAGRHGSVTRQVMRSTRFSALVRRTAGGLIPIIASCCIAMGQQRPSANSGPLYSDAPADPPAMIITLPEAPRQHSFWDRENLSLFGAVAGLSAADFAATRANLQNGGRELDPVARLFGRSTAGLAANFTGETAGVVGISYFFHKTGHHKLERLTSVINISASSFAVTYDLTHRTK